MSDILMQCGHTAQGTVSVKGGPSVPCCVTCHGINDELTRKSITPMEQLPDLTGRKARCPDCKRTTDSSLDLAFFEYRPDYDTDMYYCGCRGWD